MVNESWESGQSVALTGSTGGADSQKTEEGMTKPAKHYMNQREHMPQGIEVRYHEDGTVDEIVVTDSTGKCLLHMEQMADSRFWIGLYGLEEREYPVHVDIFTDGRMASIDDDDYEKGLQQIFARIRT